MTTESPTYADQIEAWRAQMDATLRSDTGWLTVAGLFWLHDGSNSIGGDPACDIVLPGSAPTQVGSIVLHDTTVTFTAAPGVAVNINGQPATARVLQDADTDAPDVIAIGDCSLVLLRRGERIGARLRDKNSAARRNFAGRIWFPIDETLRFDATFTPYDPPKPITITNILGDSSDVNSPGAARFTYAGQTYTLDASSLSEAGLWFVFRDHTSGHSTYGAARFLTIPAPVDGRVVLDFNRAVSPPCAFTDYATCPLPPRQNHLPFEILAGERYGKAYDE